MTAGNGDSVAFRVPEATEEDGLLFIQVSFHVSEDKGKFRNFFVFVCVFLCKRMHSNL